MLPPVFCVYLFQYKTLNEEVSVYVEADNEAEAEAIGVAMLEDGKLYCISQICVEATAVLV